MRQGSRRKTLPYHMPPASILLCPRWAIGSRRATAGCRPVSQSPIIEREEPPSFRRSGFRRDPLRHRAPEVWVCRGGFRRDPCAIQGRGLGDGMKSNGEQLPCLNLLVQRREGGSLYPSSDPSGIMSQGSSRGAGGPAAWGAQCGYPSSSMSIPEAWMCSWIGRERARSPRERVG
jgi:hypothetical protein